MPRRKLTKFERQSRERQRLFLAMAAQLMKIAKIAIKHEVSLPNWLHATINAYKDASR